MALCSHVWLPISWPGQGEGEGGHLKERGHERVFSPIMILFAYLAHFTLAFSFTLVHFPLSVKILSLLCDHTISSSFLISQECDYYFSTFFLRVYD